MIASAVFLDVALLVLAATMLPAIWRLVTGPADADRAIGSDHVFFVFVAAAALLALRSQRYELFDVVLVATVVGFLSAVTLALYIARGRR